MVTIKEIGGTIRIGYSGTELGNTNQFFGPDGDANLGKFLANFPRKAVFDMYAVGEDHILEVDDLRPEIANEIKSDALITTNPDNLLLLKAADCIPMVAYAPDGSALALAHVGRPGAMIGLHTKLIERLGVEPSILKIHLGPSISLDSYKFPLKDFDKKLDVSWDEYIHPRGDFIHIDLLGYVLRGIKASGVLEQNITHDEEDTGGPAFFSHRRSSLTGEPEGRNAFAVHLA